MATNRYGDFNTQPLYNATGRLNRGPEVGSTQFQAPNSGANRQWGSNQGMPSSGLNPIVNSLTTYWSPFNLYDMARFSDRGMYDRKSRRGGLGERGGVGPAGGGRGGGGGGSTRVVPEGGEPYTISGNTNIQIGGDITFAEQNRQANTKTLTATATGGTPTGAPAQASKRAPRAPRTAEQKAARNAKDRERRAAAKASPKPAAAPASPVVGGGVSNQSSDATQANQVANPVYNTSVGGMQGKPAAQPQAPGASGFGAAQNMFNITGGTVNAPTTPTKGRSRKAR